MVFSATTTGLPGLSQWAITPLGVAIGLLPILAFLALTAVTASYRSAGPGRLREALLIAAVGCAVWLVAGTEVLSLFRGVQFRPVFFWWVIPALLLTSIALHRRRHLRSLLTAPRTGWGIWFPLSLTVGLILLAGVAAALSSPTTSDALRYHMPRQVRWLQQGSVEHFPGNPHMLIPPPLAEFAGLHFLVLSGGDFYASLVQWFALVLAAVAASLTARELAGRALAQAMAALLVVTSPMTWLQASTVKNDVVVALWVLVVAYGLVRVLKSGRCSIPMATIIGSAAGLAMLTKPTGAMFLLPMLVLLGGWLLIQQRHRCVPAGLAIAMAILAINSGHFMRNARMFESPLPNVIRYEGRPLTNENRSPAAVLSNVTRNVALQLGTPWRKVNRESHRIVAQLHTLTGHNINDPRTTIYGEFRVDYTQRQESRTASPFHVLLFIVAMVVLPVIAWRGHRRAAQDAPTLTLSEAAQAAALMAAVLGALVVFAAVLKWQPWHARMHIGILALAAPVTATILARGSGHGAILIALALLIPLTPTILWNDTRPLVGQRSLWLMPRDRMQDRQRPPEVADEAVEFLRLAAPEVLAIIVVRDGEFSLVRRLLYRLDPPPVIMDPLIPTGRRMPRPWPTPDLFISDVYRDPQIRESSTGATLDLVHIIGDFRIYARPGFTRSLHEQGLLPEPPQ